MLRKLETNAKIENCVRIMACIPNTRVSMCQWIQRKGFRHAGQVSYPSIGHTLITDNVHLEVYLKQLSKLNDLDDIADSKDPIGETVLSLNQSQSASDDIESTQHPLHDTDVNSGKLTLPPHWRSCQNASTQISVNSSEEAYIDPNEVGVD
jgi:hypothetical protein